MHFFTTIFTLATLIATFFAQTGGIKNETQKYYLKTQLRPNQPGKPNFEGLYLSATHTGAGTNDATLTKNQSLALSGFLNGTNGKSGNLTYRDQIFHLGTEYPWSLIPNIWDTAYTSWQPVIVNTGGGADNPAGNSGFYVDVAGLQWTNELDQEPEGTRNSFGGWFVCDWWHHNKPQLFFRMKSDDPSTVPCSCADVRLMPEYL